VTTLDISEKPDRAVAVMSTSVAKAATLGLPVTVEVDT
jgi:hypothetical protein